jgi:hypothetical protein
VETYFKECDLWSKRLDELHHAIKTLKPADFDVHKADYFALLASVRQVQGGLSGIRATFPPPTASTASGSATQDMKLPKLELEQFHGNYLEWTTFKNTFEAAVHNNNKLSKVQKFAYLKSLLKGEPSRCTADLALTDGNYDQAWAQLHDRYENQRKIQMAIMDRYVSLPKTNGTSKSIKGLIDGTNRCIRSLEQYGLKHLELFYVHNIISKLDGQAKDLLEHRMKNKQLPPLTNLLEFLERHATALEEIVPAQKQEEKKERKASAYYTDAPKKQEKLDSKSQRMSTGNRQQSQRKCKLCLDPGHAIWKCSRFMEADVQERWNIAKIQVLCFKCLGDTQGERCSCSFNCRKCSKPHHTLLHSEPNLGQNRNNQNQGQSSRNYQNRNQFQGQVRDGNVYHTDAHLESSSQQ